MMHISDTKQSWKTISKNLCYKLIKMNGPQKYIFGHFIQFHCSIYYYDMEIPPINSLLKLYNLSRCQEVQTIVLVISKLFSKDILIV